MLRLSWEIKKKRLVRVKKTSCVGWEQLLLGAKNILEMSQGVIKNTRSCRPEFLWTISVFSHGWKCSQEISCGIKLTTFETPWSLVRTVSWCHKNPKTKNPNAYLNRGYQFCGVVSCNYTTLPLTSRHRSIARISIWYIASDTDKWCFLWCAETLAANFVTWRLGWKMGDTRGHRAVCKEALESSALTCFPQLI